ncbi:hypothetical protein ACLB1R_02725 [Escherichia coli]
MRKDSLREATRKSMGQIQGALVGIAMVLSAVFVPGPSSAAPPVPSIASSR